MTGTPLPADCESGPDLGGGVLLFTNNDLAPRSGRAYRAASGWRKPAGFPHAGTLVRGVGQITFGENS